MSELSQLRWRCRRGMRELDQVMLHYLDHHYAAASPDEQAAFRELLDRQDPELLAFLTGRTEPEQAAAAHVIHTIRTTYRP